MKRRPPQSGQKVIRVAAILLSSALIVGILYWAKVVLIPLALAVLLTFILSPIVTRLDRWGLRRIPSVIVVVTAAGLLLAAMTWLLGSQIGSLANDLPSYQENIREKVATIRDSGSGGVLERVRSVFAYATRSPAPTSKVENGVEADSPPNLPEPIAVRVVAEQEGSEKALGTVMASVMAMIPALGGLATIGIAMVLVIFMLINLEDLRNRLVSFTARDNLAVTTRALDEAGDRISRYLIIQLIINGTFGLAVAIGLLLIGVPYALLWGLCAGVFRYIPYFGPWVAALLPLSVSLITSPDWTQVLLVLGIFLAFELVSNNVMEPLLYGQGIGVSAIALIISATFWTWIWGPIGLVLATPLTVCLAVIGKYVPSLAFFDKLLGDRPALEPKEALLQRLLARDDLEASKIVSRYHAEHGAAKTYDEVLIPALALARRERARGSMDAEEETFALDVTRNVQKAIVSRGKKSAVEESQRTAHETENGKRTGAPNATAQGSADSPAAINDQVIPQDSSARPPMHVIGCAAHQEAEELTLHMLDDLVSSAGLKLEILSTRTLPSEVVECVARERPFAVVIAALPPGGLIQARFLCKTLRKRFPELRIVVGCWMYRGNLDRVIVRLRSAGAHYITTTLQGARDHVLSLAATHADQNQSTFGPDKSLTDHVPLDDDRPLMGSQVDLCVASSGEPRSSTALKPK